MLDVGVYCLMERRETGGETVCPGFDSHSPEYSVTGSMNSSNCSWNRGFGM